MNKLVLSRDHDKQVVQSDALSTLAYRHKEASSMMSLKPESFESLADFHPTLKMDDLKPISHREFNEFIKGKGFKGRKDYALRDLKAKFSLKPLVERRALVVSLEGMEPSKFDSMRKAAKAFGIGEGVIRHARNNGRDFIKRFEGKGVFQKVVLI